MRTRALVSAVLFGVCGSVSFAQPAVARSDVSRSPARTDAVVRAGDRVRLKVWREPDLSGEFTVDEDGVAVFPKVGRLDVKLMSTDSLKSVLIGRLSVSLRNPSVDVTVLRRVNVLGAVRSPGVFYVDPTTTVSDVLALAGGVSPEGNQNRFELIRNGARLPVELSRESRLADSPLQSGDQLRVPERSWFARNTALVGASLTAVAILFAARVR